MLRATPTTIAVLYTLAGLLWVYFIDQWLLARYSEGSSLISIKMIDALFVLATAGSIYWLIQINTLRLRKAHEELEARVQERTAKLAALNEQLQSEAAQRKHTEEALRESEARYRSVVEAQSELICHFKPDGTLTFVNLAYCRYFGKTSSELIGQKFLPMIPAEDLAEVKQALASLNLNNPRITWEHRIIKPNGELAWQQWTDSIITNEQGQITELQGVGRDITERKQAEDKLRRLQAELAQAVRLSFLGEIAKSLAHELNQPLTAIVTYTQACQNLLRINKGQTEELVEAMEQVASQGLRASEIIRRMRKFTQTRISRPGTVDLTTLIGEVVNLVAWEARQRQVSIHLDLAENLPSVSTDITQIQQTLLMLLNNALETVSNHPDERYITLRAMQIDKDTVEIAISDSGPALSEEALKRMFDSLFTPGPQGVGLALCRSLIESQGGRLWAIPNPDRGTTYRFTLPLHRTSLLSPH